MTMQLVIQYDGTLRCLYGETLDLSQFGQLMIRRGSHVEPDAQGLWRADMAPAGGPVLGPFPRRSDALAAEEAWLSAYWLTA